MNRFARLRLMLFGAGLTLIIVLNGAAEPILTPFWGPIQRGLAIGDARMGIVISGIAVGLVLGTVIFRFAQARLGWRPALAIAAIVFWPALALVPIPGFWWGVLAANILWGIGNGGVDVVWGALASRFERAASSGRRHLLGLQALKEVGSSVGAVTGGIVLGQAARASGGAAILDREHVVGILLPFGVGAAGLVVVAVLVMPRIGGASGRNNGDAAPAVAVTSSLRRQVRLLSVVAIAAAAPLGAMYAWSGQALGRLGVPGGWVASGLTAFVLVRAVILGTAWGLSRRVSPRGWVGRGGLVALLGSGIIAGGMNVDSAFAVVAGMAMVGGGLAAVSAMAMSVAGESASAAEVGAAKEDAAVGLVVVLNHVGISSAPFVVGALASLFGLAVALPATMITCCLVVVVLAGRAFRVRPAGT